MLNIKSILYGTLSLLCSSCSLNERNLEINKYHFDLSSNLIEQITVLTKLNPLVKKQIEFNAKMENDTVSDVEWKEELSELWKWDLHQEKFSGVFMESKSIVDKGTMYSYRLVREMKNMQVEKYTVLYNKDDILKEININVSEESFFYTNRSSFQLVFNIYENKYPMLKEYTMERIKVSRWIESSNFYMKANILQIK